MKNRSVAPAGLRPPDYASTWLGNRDETILEHGFTSSIIGPEWWNQRLGPMGFDQQVTVPSHPSGNRLTRGDLFRLGKDARDSDWDEDSVLTLLWHVLAWGTGTNQRGNAARLRAFAESPQARRERVVLLAEAFGNASGGDPASAYKTLVRPGGAKIPGLGPAFFTKALYFASEGCSAGSTSRSLILDARVAENLARAGWASLPRGRGGYSYNWYTDTYRSYCELLGRWADEASDTMGVPVAPDEFERALFAGGPRPSQSTAR